MCVSDAGVAFRLRPVAVGVIVCNLLSLYLESGNGTVKPTGFDRVVVASSLKVLPVGLVPNSCFDCARMSRLGKLWLPEGCKRHPPDPGLSGHPTFMQILCAQNALPHPLKHACVFDVLESPLHTRPLHLVNLQLILGGFVCFTVCPRVSLKPLLVCSGRFCGCSDILLCQFSEFHVGSTDVAQNLT